MSDSVRMYRIICLKRSVFEHTEDFEYRSEWFAASKLVYWRSNCAGYTEDVNEAGLYFNMSQKIVAVNMATGYQTQYGKHYLSKLMQQVVEIVTTQARITIFHTKRFYCFVQHQLGLTLSRPTC